MIGTFVEEKKHINQTTAPVPLSSPGYAAFDLIGYWNLSKQAALNFGLFNLTDRKYFLWSDMQGVGGGTAAMPATAGSLDALASPDVTPGSRSSTNSEFRRTHMDNQHVNRICWRRASWRRSSTAKTAMYFTSTWSRSRCVSVPPRCETSATRSPWRSRNTSIS